MKLKYIKNKDIDKSKWNKTIDNSINNNILGYSWFLDHISPKWGAIIADDYKYVLPLPIKNFWLFKIVYMPPFYNRIAVYSTEQVTEEIVLEFLNKIPKNFIIFSLAFSLEKFANKNFLVDNRTFQTLNINRAYQDIYSGFSRRIKRNFNKANENNIKVEKTDNFDNFVVLKQYLNIKKNIGLKPKYFDRMQSLFRYCQKNCELAIYDAYYDQKPCSSAVFLIFNSHAFLFSATNDPGRQTGAYYLIMDTFLKEYAQKLNILDFGGSSLAGLKETNLQLGSENHEYVILQDKFASFLQKIFY